MNGSPEKNKNDYTIEISTKKGETVNPEPISLGDIKVNITGEGFCDGVIKISFTKEDNAPVSGTDSTRLGIIKMKLPEYVFRESIDAAITDLWLGDEDRAKEEREGAFRGVVNDEHLMKCIARREVPGETREAHLLRAVVNLYSGFPSLADDDLVRIDLTGDFEAIYLKARCCECMECWNEVKRLYSHLLKMYFASSVDERLKPAFRKFLFRLSVLNESRFKDAGVGIMRDLALETQDEDCFLALREQLRSGRVPKAPVGYNDLLVSLYDPSVDDELFMQNLRTATALDLKTWEEFIATLRSLDLPYPWN